MSHFSCSVKVHGIELEVIGSYSARCGRFDAPDDYNEVEDITAVHAGSTEITAIVESSAEVWSSIKEQAHKFLFGA